jgi:glycerol-3-phosphate O-acyltransferase/dihydroxyacetone phosphate acyltransferase
MADNAKDKGKKPLAVMNKYVYDAFLWTFSILVELFFREVHPRSSWKVPKEGPVIFVCAPHANQVGHRRLVWSRNRIANKNSSLTLSC